MKQAVLIIAHNNLEILRKNILLLNSEKIDIFIHIDKKSSITESDIFDNLFVDENKISNVFVFKKISINWGGYSQIETEYFLLKESVRYALKNNINYSHYHLISGVDMPIKTSYEICDFFEKNIGKEFIHFYSENLDSKIVDRYKYYHILVENSWKRKEKGKRVFSFFSKMFKLLQIIFRIDRSNKNIKYQYGCNWFSITDDFAKYVVEHERIVKKMFKYTLCCDEVFLQTLFINSPFKDNLYNDDFKDNYENCVRYIDWLRGNPYIFRVEDFKSLTESKMIFARKFDYCADSKIVEELYSYLKEKEEIYGKDK